MVVSIHALLAECDGYRLEGMVLEHVSIHALLAECDASQNDPDRIDEEFQSTHSLRSATASCNGFHIVPTVSIHALLAECDPPR